MEFHFKETGQIQIIKRPDGSLASRIPLSRRYYLFCFLLGLCLEPLFGFAPFFVESFSIIFTIAWSAGVFLFFFLLLWFGMSYLKNPNKFSMVVDSTGILQPNLLSESLCKWEDVESVDSGDGFIGLRLKKPKWHRRWRLQKFDVIFPYQYVVSHAEIASHLQEWQQKVTSLDSEQT